MITSDTHKTGTRGFYAFDSNTREVLATLNTGIGQSHLRKLLSTLTVLPLSPERENGKAVEKVAKLSCQNATEQEKILSLENGNSVGTDGLVCITCSYDMCWQKRGRSFN